MKKAKTILVFIIIVIFYPQILCAKMQEEGNILKTFDEQFKSDLEFMATNFTGKAALEARNLLCFFTGDCVDIDFPWEDSKKEKSTNTEDEFVEEIGPLAIGFDAIQIKPNPNSGSFELTTVDGCEIKAIKITNVEGNKINYDITDQYENVRLIDLQHTISGLYIVSVECVDGKIYKKTIVINK